MAGFITGLGIEVFTNQVRKILAAPHVADAATGVLAAAERLKETMASSVSTEGYFVEVIALIQSIPRANLYSVAIGVSAFLIVRLMKRYAPQDPRRAGGPGAADDPRRAASTSPAKGVGVLGAIPSGAPDADPARDSRWPTTCGCCRAPWRSWPSSSAKACWWSAATATSTATRRTATRCCSPTARPTWRPASPGRCVTGNSPSRSAAMDASGAKSQLPSLVAAGTIARGAALLHRPAGVPAQRGAGRDRRQRGAVADRGPRAARAVADAPLGVLDRRRLPGERAGPGAAARRRSSPSCCPPST